MIRSARGASPGTVAWPASTSRLAGGSYIIGGVTTARDPGDRVGPAGPGSPARVAPVAA